ncbi:MAG: glycosyltransferase family 39 protein [Anaerolineales bacterium]|nr:glycosyltransferase family 39 protein [Anaerolineales bacterium]
MKPRSCWQYGILVLGIAISAILVAAFPDFYHHGDIGAFMDWARQWNQGWSAVYESCPSCNYPILGMAGSAGVFKLLWKAGIPNAEWVFRFLLAVVDGLNVFLVFLILKELKIKNAALWAGITGLLISSWAGGAVWGQIDGISQFFILAVLYWIIRFQLTGGIHPVVFFVAVSLLTAMLLLTKQLSIFSLFSIELLLIVCIFYGRKIRTGFPYLGMLLALQFFFVFAWDLFLKLPDSYRSHLPLVWGARSNPGGLLSANGINLWVLLDRDMWRSSSDPLFPDTGSAFANLLTPYGIGIVLFLVFAAGITLSLLSFLRRRRPANVAGMDREALLNFILHLALINLAFNLLLTGTHERYLFHCYPFLLAACLGLREYDRRFSGLIAAMVLVGANLYGLFVLGVLHGELAWNYQVHKYLAVYHLGMLTVLLFLTLRYPWRSGGTRGAQSVVK